MHPFTEYLNPYLGELLHNVALDKTFVRGEGCYLYDDHGNGYLDCIAAYGALPFGHNPARIWEAVADFRHSRSLILSAFISRCRRGAGAAVGKLAPPGCALPLLTAAPKRWRRRWSAARPRGAKGFSGREQLSR